MNEFDLLTFYETINLVSQQIPILYGGSVNLKNASSLIKQPDIDGLFIGRAALDVFSFIKIVQAVEMLKK